MLEAVWKHGVLFYAVGSDVYTGNLQQDHCQSDTQATGAGGGKDGKKPAPADEACPGQI